MEALNNVATAAAKAVWGDENAPKEPVSGAKGDVSKGEPYDAGNLEPARQEQVEKSLEGRQFENTSAAQPAQENTIPEQQSPFRQDDIAKEKIAPKIVEATPSETTSKPSKPSEVLEGYSFRPAEAVDSRPTENAPLPSSMDSGANKLPETSPPGPKLPSDKVGNEDENEDEDESSKGTGQEYVRSSGLAADGGDFDATRPGAGREADRLMEEKGIHEGEDGANGDKGKPSIGHRIKAKLHRH